MTSSSRCHRALQRAALAGNDTRSPWRTEATFWALGGHLFPVHRLLQQGVLGDIDFGPNAFIDLHDVQLRWFDYWLKGINNGLTEESPIRLFVMGTNQWRDEEEWPLARTHYTPYYFHSRGKANTLHGDGTLSMESPGEEPGDHYRYDPADPVPTCGGNTLIIPVSTGPTTGRRSPGRVSIHQ